MLYVFIPPKWLKQEQPETIQMVCSFEETLQLNEAGFGVYYYPNGVTDELYESLPDNPRAGGKRFLKAGDINKFDYVLLDLDMKHGVYESYDAFLEQLLAFELTPSKIILSGNGVHAYWKVTDLDAMSFLRLTRRICRKFNSDHAVAMIKQLMRVPGTLNTKDPTDYKPCELIEENDNSYTCEELSKALPPITSSDEEFCISHFNTAYSIEDKVAKVDVNLPSKFKRLVKESKEVREIFSGNVSDRSQADWRLAHILFAQGFTKDEALSVLVNSPKAIERSPTHRVGYASGIIDKIWTYENTEDKESVQLSHSVREIVNRKDAMRGIRLPCWDVFDGTEHGFHLTEVLGLVGGAGSGKTTLALNYFYHFSRLNPDFHHMFVSLEQPEEEIAKRWVKIAGKNERLHDKVHVLGNYNPDGSYRNLSLNDIQEYLIKLQTEKKIKIGCCVIDHIGVLKKVSKEGESQGIIDICHQMKAFAKSTNTFLVMQSQTSREKAGIGDVELNKDAAYGTSMFEWYVDYLVTTWQPLVRIYDLAPHMTCSSFKYCKIRHKNVLTDKSKENSVHVLMFNPKNELLSLMNQSQKIAYEEFNDKATKIRNKDRKREPTRITSIDWSKEEVVNE